MPCLHEEWYFSFSDLPYEQARRSAWTSHSHPTQSKGKNHFHVSNLWAQYTFAATCVISKVNFRTTSGATSAFSSEGLLHVPCLANLLVVCRQCWVKLLGQLLGNFLDCRLHQVHDQIVLKS